MKINFKDKGYYFEVEVNNYNGRIVDDVDINENTIDNYFKESVFDLLSGISSYEGKDNEELLIELIDYYSIDKNSFIERIKDKK